MKPVQSRGFIRSIALIVNTIPIRVYEKPVHLLVPITEVFQGIAAAKARQITNASKQEATKTKRSKYIFTTKTFTEVNTWNRPITSQDEKIQIGYRQTKMKLSDSLRRFSFEAIFPQIARRMIWLSRKGN